MVGKVALLPSIIEAAVVNLICGRHAGLNTVELLKIASSSLNIGPHVAMNIAERLYTAGLLSYPRTESSAYPKSFDFRAVLRDHGRNAIWGEYASALLAHGFSEPKVQC